MKRPPRPPKENLFAGSMIIKILATGSIMALAAILAQTWAYKNGYDTRTQQTMIFTLLSFIQMGNACSVRFTYQSIFSSRIFSNWKMWAAILLIIVLQLLIIYVPVLHDIFKTVALDWSVMSLIIIATVLSILCIEGVKAIANSRGLKVF